MKPLYVCLIAFLVPRALTKAYYSVLHAGLLVYPTVMRSEAPAHSITHGTSHRIISIPYHITSLVRSCDWACLSIPLIESAQDPRYYGGMPYFFLKASAV